MELSLNPIDYLPKYNTDSQKYEDQYIFDFQHGVTCPCTGNLYMRRSSFHSHTKTQIHRKWINMLNENQMNYYQKSLDLERTVRTQQEILTKIQNELEQKKIIIRYLEKSLKSSEESFREKSNDSSSMLIDFMD
jgi:YesN/AraC family two-component response regulator